MSMMGGSNGNPEPITDDERKAAAAMRKVALRFFREEKGREPETEMELMLYARGPLTERWQEVCDELEEEGIDASTIPPL